MKELQNAATRQLSRYQISNYKIKAFIENGNECDQDDDVKDAWSYLVDTSDDSSSDMDENDTKNIEPLQFQITLEPKLKFTPSNDTEVKISIDEVKISLPVSQQSYPVVFQISMDDNDRVQMCNIQQLQRPEMEQLKTAIVGELNADEIAKYKIKSINEYGGVELDDDDDVENAFDELTNDNNGPSRPLFLKVVLCAKQMNSGDSLNYRFLLQKWKLAKFSDKLEEDGWIEPIDWKELTDNDLRNDIGFGKGDIVRFRKHYREWLKLNDDEYEEKKIDLSSPVSQNNDIANSIYSALINMGFEGEVSMYVAQKGLDNIDDAVNYVIYLQAQNTNFNERRNFSNDEQINYQQDNLFEQFQQQLRVSNTMNNNKQASMINNSNMNQIQSQLINMGFPQELCAEAAIKFPDNVNDAINWITTKQLEQIQQNNSDVNPNDRLKLRNSRDSVESTHYVNRMAFNNQQNTNINEQKLNNQFIEECKSVERCSSLKRIVGILSLYKDFNKSEEIAASLSTFQSFQHVVNDYQHALQQHDNFASVYNFVVKNNGLTCNINQCKIFFRNNQKKKGISLQCNDKNILLYMDILDTVHCYFVHTIDIGYAVNDRPQNMSTSSRRSIAFDEEMNNLKSFVSAKRKYSYKNNGGMMNKFMTELKSDEMISKVDEETKMYKDEEEKMHPTMYSFGERFDYWDNKRRHVAKYGSIKEEILYNDGVFRQNKDLYNIMYQKANHFLANSNAIRLLKCNQKNPYRIDIGACIKVENIMVIIFYTDFDTLSSDFSKTFRKLKPNEPFEAVEKRNGKYWHWSKCLIETVNCFGEKMDKSNIVIFYHGISEVYFDSFVATFNSPTSTTSKLHVALAFAQRGLILELKMNKRKWGRNLTHFNCSLVSCFGSEDERLFIQPLDERGCLEFFNIRHIETSENFRDFIDALTIFQKIIINDYHTDICSKSSISKIALFLNQSNYNANFPYYILKCFKKWIENTKQIRINLETLPDGLIEELCHEKVEELLLFDKIVNVFRNCEKISCRRTNRISVEYLGHLLQILVKINKMKHSKLTKIYILNIEDAKIDVIQFNKYKSLAMKLNWRIDGYDGDDLVVSKGYNVNKKLKSKNKKSNNKYNNESWLQFDEYLSWETGERIYMCSLVERERVIWWNEKRVLLLSSFEKLYLINHETHTIEQEWTKRVIKRIETLQSQKRFVLHLTTNKIWFKCLDTANAKSWQKTIAHVIFKVVM
eukprot:163010_1